MRASLLLLTITAFGHAQGGLHELVDRLSARVDARLGGTGDAEHFRELRGATADPVRIVVTSVAMAAPVDGVERLTVTVEKPRPGARLLLVDAGVVFRGPKADYVAVPNQRFILEASTAKLTLEALPLWPERPRPKPGTPLKAVRTNDPGLLAVLRIVQRIEATEVEGLARYLGERDGRLEVQTRVDNRDVRLARWMSWSKNAAGRIEGRLPREAIRFAIFAVTAGYTIQETADWLRRVRHLDLEPAMARAGELSRQTTYLLERAGLNFRLFSQEHADFHVQRGIVLFRTGDLPGALKSFRAALERQPGNPRAQYNLGVTYYRMGKYRKAAEMFLVASGMRGATADVHYNRGATLFRLDDRMNAARAFRKALLINARDPDAARWLQTADPDNRTAPKKKKKKRRRRRKKRGR